MKKTIWGFFCVLLCLFTVPVNVCAKTFDETLYAGAAVLMDADSGRVLYAKNGEEFLANASTTKILTCIVVLENMDLNETVTVSAYAAGMPKVHLGMRKGESYRALDLVYSMMLESHNDSAAALAEHLGKKYLSQQLKTKDPAEYTTEESKLAIGAFCRLMNAKASEIGCKNTCFLTPNGLDASCQSVLEDGTVETREHGTTAEDLARILSYCVRRSPMREMFLQITGTPSYSFGAGNRSFFCSNHNAFLNMMSGAISGKTGFTNKAGYCYAGALESDGRFFVVALLACGWPNHKTYKWKDTEKLMRFGMANYAYRSFLDPTVALDPDQLKPIEVKDGRSNVFGETAYCCVRIAGRDGEEYADGEEYTDGETGEGTDGLLMQPEEKIFVRVTLQKEQKAPVYAGEKVGTILYCVDGTVYRTENIVASQTVERVDYKWCISEIIKRFVLF